MPDTIVQTLVDGVRIVVPDSLDLITPYVLREQQDFFEVEHIISLTDCSLPPAASSKRHALHPL